MADLTNNSSSVSSVTYDSADEVTSTVIPAAGVAVPLISVVTVVFNGEKYIERALKSILSQDYENVEYIVIDGGSTDSTVDIVMKYEDEIDLIISEQDDGMYDALNKGFTNAKGDILCWLNSDDYMFPKSLRTVADVFNRYPDVEWLTGRKVIINDSDQVIKLGCFRRFVKHHIRKGYQRGDVLGFITQESTFWRRSLYEKAGSYINHEYKLASDFELWTRFARYAELYSVNTLLGAFRLHRNQLSTDKASYYIECDAIKNINIARKAGLKLLKYLFYLYGIISSKNKIYISDDGIVNKKRKWVAIE